MAQDDNGGLPESGSDHRPGAVQDLVHFAGCAEYRSESISAIDLITWTQKNNRWEPAQSLKTEETILPPSSSGDEKTCPSDGVLVQSYKKFPSLTTLKIGGDTCEKWVQGSPGFDHHTLDFSTKAEERIKYEITDAEVALPDIPLRLNTPRFRGTEMRFPWTKSKESMIRDLISTGVNVRSSPSDRENNAVLSWAPFRSLAVAIGLQEQFASNKRLERHINMPQGINESPQMLWKKHGLRLLDMDQYSVSDELDEDVTLLGDSESHTSPSTKHYSTYPILSVSSNSVQPDKISHVMLTKKTVVLDKEVSTGDSALFAASSLHDFLDLRGHKFKKQRLSSDRIYEQADNDPIQTTQPQAPNVPTCSASYGNEHDLESRVTSTTEKEPAAGTSIPIPEMSKNLTPRIIVLMASMVKQHKSLVKFLETQGRPQLMMIYREEHCSDVSYAEETAPADLILNPGSCVVYINHQTLNQRSLPGQPKKHATSMEYARIRALAAIYDRVFLLVTYSMHHAQSSRTIAAFNSFAQTISEGSCFGAVQPIWICTDHGDVAYTATLNAWTWKLVTQHALCTDVNANSETVCCIQDETVWELFLRRLMLNPLAAQVVLAFLKAFETTVSEVVLPGQETSVTWGLRRLVQMSAMERTSMFGELIGKANVNNINTILETQWAPCK